MQHTRYFTEADVYALLQQGIREAGSQARFADHHRISRQYLSDVMRRRRTLGHKILEAVGLEKVAETFRKKT